MTKILRDDFSEKTKRTAAERVGFLCSNPDCRSLTIGTSDMSNESVAKVGVAAHICAAAPGGPRYDVNMTPEERASIDNCIWLCPTHSVHIDRDVKRYPKELLIQWKKEAENYTAFLMESQKNVFKAIENKGFDLDETDKTLYELIANGEFNILNNIINSITTSITDPKFNELMQYYKIVFLYYCDRSNFSSTLSCYFSRKSKLYADRLVSLFIENLDKENLSIAINHCEDLKLQSIAKYILHDEIEGNIINIVRKDKDLDDLDEINTIEICQPTMMINKLVTNYALKKGVNKILKTDMTEATYFKAEFYYEIRVKINEFQKKVFNTIGLEAYGFSADKEFLEIYNQIDKIKLLDVSLQENIWDVLLHLTLEDSVSFDMINKKCPTKIKELKKIKPLSLKHTIVTDIASVNFDEVIICCDESNDYSIAVVYLLRLGNEGVKKPLLLIENHKYLFKKSSDFLSVYIDLKRKIKSNFSPMNFLLEYADIYVDDFSFHCLRAMVVKNNKKYNKIFRKDVIWLLNYIAYGRIPLKDVIPFVEVLSKARRYKELLDFYDDNLPVEFRVRIASCLQNSKDTAFIKNAQEIYLSLDASSALKNKPKGLYGNIGLCAHLLKDYSTAKTYYKKEFLCQPSDNIAKNLLGLRYETNEWIDDEVFAYAKASTDSELLQLAGAFCIELKKTGEAKFYFLKSLLINDKNLDCLSGYFTQIIQKPVIEAPEQIQENTIAKLVAGTDTVLVALHTEEQIQGIIANNFAKCFHYAWNDEIVSDLYLRAKGEEAKFRNKEYIIEDIINSEVQFSSYAMNCLVEERRVLAVKGDPESAIKEIINIVDETSKEVERIIDLYNESQQYLPLTLFSNNIGKNILETLEFLLYGNKVKIINNTSSATKKDKTFILTIDSIYILNSLDIKKETLLEVKFICPMQTKNLILSEIEKMQIEIKNPNSKGHLFVVNGKLGINQQTADQKRQQLKKLNQLKDFVKSFTCASQSYTFNSNNKEMRDLFVKSKLYTESDTLGLLNSIDNTALLTDNRFLYTLASLENKECMGMNGFLNLLDISSSERLNYIIKLAKMNFLNYFSVSEYTLIKKKILMLPEVDRNEPTQKLFDLLISKPFDDEPQLTEHNFNVIMKLGHDVRINKVDGYNIFDDALRKSIITQFARKNPEQYKKMLEDAIQRMRVEIRHDNENIYMDVGFVEDPKENKDAK